MPLLKPIAGHTGCAGIKRYLEKGGRALGVSLMNFAWQEERVFEDAAAAPPGFDWAEAMDATRHACGNDTPYRGKPARTFKHFVMSPDPQDGLSTGFVTKIGDYENKEIDGEYMYWNFSINGVSSNWGCNQIRCVDGTYLLWEYIASTF